ncbi:2-polyprenylphenol 6-hydroxylase [Oceanomicrobium pacificus]|uniref:2-polyprenylphenol 6-hydroxylase n=1 Tax=Oceanomicrobium pacificus TaxID=2692916 RepID=A0A6B0TV68_9RHOB|nr:2-polyprenylphenol 6-hydroxylase [Oceanomicrobium pacificus]MXU64853.1 2-polyprenylphenol 6-hydroxylase [Oceanomicrobium pacificus]
MRGPHNIWRLIRTGATFERTGAMKIALEALDAPRSLRITARVLGWPFKWLGYKGDPSQPPVLRALTALGPAYIKFGQIMSTRPDVVGPDLAQQLRVLQDKLPAFPTETARAIVEQELDRPVDDLFSEFSEPVAAASLAQVHKATVRGSGDTVAVKVLRPGIERQFLRDVDAFYLAAWLIDRLAPSARRLKPRAVIEHFDSVVQGELDLRMESAACDEFHANTEGDEGFRVPKLYWDLSARRMMTTGWVDGIPFGEVEAIRATGIDMPDLANRVVQSFLRHALRDGFFHADMHQGNLKLAPNGDILAMDFGIMGRIDAYTRRVYAEILIGFLRRDYRRVAEVHFEAGYVPADRDVEAFAQALRSVGEPIFGHDASQISMARLLAHLFDVTERFGMETRTELILLQRTMVVVEGVARSIDPAMNMWQGAHPVVETYIADNIGPKAVIRDLRDTAIVLSRFGPRLPDLVNRALIRANAGDTEPDTAPLPVWLWLLLGAAGGGLLVALLELVAG